MQQAIWNGDWSMAWVTLGQRHLREFIWCGFFGSFDLSENGAVVRVRRVNEGWLITLRGYKALGGSVSVFIKFFSIYQILAFYRILFLAYGYSPFLADRVII